MTVNTIITVLLIVAAAAVFGIALYTYLKNTALSEIRADVYQLFLKAEHLFTETKQGKQKLDWVVQRARQYLPGWTRTIITDELLYKVIDNWFGTVKDLLDDGKSNKSVEGE